MDDNWMISISYWWLTVDNDANEFLDGANQLICFFFSLPRLIDTDWHCGDDVGHIRLRRRTGQCWTERTEGPTGGSDRYKLPRRPWLLSCSSNKWPNKQQQCVNNIAQLFFDARANHTGRFGAIVYSQATTHANVENSAGRWRRRWDSCFAFYPRPRLQLAAEFAIGKREL